MPSPLAASAMHKTGINTAIDMSVEDAEVRRNLKRVVKNIVDGAMSGVNKANEKTYDEAMKGLLKFNHTRHKESLKGLVKKPIKYDIKSDSYLAETAQISIAGKILEFKGFPDNKGISSKKSGIISLSNPHQRRAHVWLREKGLTGARLRENSQISPTGPMKNVKPMQDARDNYLEKEGIDTIAREIIKTIR